MCEMNGYEHKTGELAFSVEIPDFRVRSVRNTAGVPLCDDGLGSYPLDPGLRLA